MTYTAEECEVLRLHTAYLKTQFKGDIFPPNWLREINRVLDEAMDMAEEHTEKPETVQ